MRKKNLSILGITLIVLFFLFLLTGFKSFQKKYLFNNLAEAVAEESGKASLSYSLLIKDLSFPRVDLAYQDNQKVPAASLLKLPILAAVFYAVDSGKLSLDDQITIQRKDIAGGSGKLKAATLPYHLKLSELIELMISVSDNTATNKVIDILGFDYINSVFERLGLSNTNLSRKMMDFSQRRRGVENYTSAADINLILEKIYDRRLVNKELSGLGLEFLKKQKVDDRIPRYLPKATVVAHKTGLERGVVHDAGIVFAPKGNYIICVLASDVRNYRKAKKFIAETSRLAYNLYDKVESRKLKKKK